jgi:hypothetical protein
MTTPVTPLRSPAIADLRNALQLAVTYGSKDVADSDAKQALHRVQGLVARAIASLGEPNEAAITAANLFMDGFTRTLIQPGNGPIGQRVAEAWATDRRKARDVAAAILYAAVTGELGGEGWVDLLPCPSCGGSGMSGASPCEDCKATGRVR